MISKTKLAILGVISGFALMIAAPVAVNAHGYHGYEGQPNIVEKAVAINAETGEFSTLIAAASCTNIANRLSNDNRNFTLFAPTDAAFAALNLNASNVCSSFDRRTLANILKYHITRGEITAEHVLASSSLHMSNRESAVISGATIDGQNIVQTDIFVSNGVIHVVDGVLLP